MCRCNEIKRFNEDLISKEEEKKITKKCLIIAAGKGSRLTQKGDSKPLISLLGLGLLERVILAANKVGLNDFYVVTGYNGDKLRSFLDEFSRKRNLKITHVINEEWEKENGISVLKAKDLLNEHFILLMADHLFDENILLKLKNESMAVDEVKLAIDYNIENNELVDINDVTKVFIKDHKIIDIGKDLKKFHGYDTGIFLCSPIIFNALEESMQNGDRTLSGGIKVLAEKGKVKPFDIEDNFWIDIDDNNAYEKAKTKLLSDLKKTSDGPISRYINRPISIRISKYLLNTNIRPNHISFFAFFSAILGGIFFFLGGSFNLIFSASVLVGYFSLIIGATFAQVASIIDGCDGEVARLKMQATEFGGWFDSVLDRYADAFVLFTLIYYVYFLNSEFLSFLNFNFLVIAIGFLAIIGSFMNSYSAHKIDDLMKRNRVIQHKYLRIGRDVRTFIIFVGCLLNQPFYVLVVIALMTNLENVRRIVFYYKNRWN